MAEKKKQWVMTQQQYNTFCAYRQSFYKNICTNNELEYFPDDKLTKYYVWNMSLFLRHRKYPIDRPFKFQKVIFTAISLFKRYYLVNSFIGQQPMQNCICAMYLSLKLNQYKQQYILQMANSWRGKQALQPKRGHFHYNSDGYADLQYKLLAGIGFQTARTKMIHTIQSLYGKIIQNDVKHTQELLFQIRSYLLKVYIDPSIIFIYDGSKIGLSVVLCSLQKIKCSLDFHKVFGQKLFNMIEQNKQQVAFLNMKIQKLENYNQNSFKQEKTEYYRKLTKVHYKKPEYKKSPRFHARVEPNLFDQ